MHDEWPMLEFSDLHSNILELFSKETSESVAYSILEELTKPSEITNGEGGKSTMFMGNSRSSSALVQLQTEDQLRWVMQVLNHALSMSLNTEREFLTVKRAVQLYIHWLRALTDVPDASIPNPVLKTPEKYFRSIIDALRFVFVRRPVSGQVWSRTLSFMLNSADILLAPPALSDDVSVRVGSAVIDSLLGLWLHAVQYEEIPSFTYWRTLAVLLGRWRHHLFSSHISFTASQPLPETDEMSRLLFESWLSILELMPSPKEILNHNPIKNTKTYGADISQRASFTSEDYTASAPLCFFLAVTAVQKMIDIFYGDHRVNIDFAEFEAYRSSLADKAERHTGDLGGLTAEDRSSFSSTGEATTSTAPSRSNSDMKAHRTARMSDRSVNGGLGGPTASLTPPTAEGAPNSSYRRAISLSSTGEANAPHARGERAMEKAGRRSAQSSSLMSANRIVAHSMSVPHNMPQAPFIPAALGKPQPRCEKMMELTMDWLMQAGTAKREEGSGGYEKRRNTDDVISTLSIGSTGTSEDFYDRSVSSSSSGAPCSSNAPMTEVSIDGVEAGRAAALGALTRMICGKQTKERLPNEQLAAFYSALHEALIQKDRLVLCCVVYYGHSLFTLALPGVEVILPHFLYAIDVVLIESSKLRLHPSFDEREMRRACLKALSTIVCWPTTFAFSKIPQLPETPTQKTPPMTYLHLRLRFYKTLIFSLRNETDSVNLQLTLGMCGILCETSANFDVNLSEEERRQALLIGSSQSGLPGDNPEKAMCTSMLRGVVSAVCDRMCKSEWSADYSVSLAAIDLLNALSTVQPSLLFTSKEDLSTGSLIVSSLCKFIEMQLMKPPPSHSRDLHSSVTYSLFINSLYFIDEHT